MAEAPTRSAWLPTGDYQVIGRIPGGPVMRLGTVRLNPWETTDFEF